MVAIRMEGKYGVCAPYKCNGSHYHMTGNRSTVRRFYKKRREQRMANKPELTDIQDAMEIQDGPGDWLTAGFDSPCSRGCPGISAGEDIRADGEGGWECRSCVELDEAQEPASVPADLGACSRCGAAFQSHTDIHADGLGDAVCGPCIRETNS